MEPYINLRYSNSKIVIDYYLSKITSAIYRNGGITYARENLKEAKNYIFELIKLLPENRVTIKSRLRSNMGGPASQYSKIEKSELEELTDSLNEEQTNITFNLAA